MSSSHFQSSGRGGAGNIIDSSKSPPLQPEDLQTPTLKTSMVTTGRGGTGNFAAGLDAEEKRRRQDVEPVVRRESPAAMHIGRGGTGNVVKPGAEDPPTTATASATAPATASSPNPAAGAGQAVTPPSTAAAAQPSPPSSSSSGPADKEKERKDKPGSPPVGRRDDAGRKADEVGWAEKGKNLLFGKK